MSSIKYDKIVKYHICATTVSPLHIGNSFENVGDVLIDPITEVPFIQASTITGLLRSVSTLVNDNDTTCELFGLDKDNICESDANTSRVKVTDCRMVPSTVKFETRPNVSVDRKTGTVSTKNSSGQKYDITYVSQGASFSFYVYLFLQSEQYDLTNKLQAVFGTIKHDQTSIGAKKSSGAGRFTIESIKSTVYDMKNSQDRLYWCIEDGDNSRLEDITDKCCAAPGTIKYHVLIKAKSIGPIQIKGVAMSDFGENAPDSENIMNGNDDYIIPGTSIRGAIRSQMEKIASYQGKDTVIRGAFGFAAENHSDGCAGNLIFNDCVIGSQEDIDKNPVRNRIHIDKFTGGVMSQAFFKEKNASGAIDISIEILDRQNPDATLGLLLYALRDLKIKTFNIGNGYATGKGFLDIADISIRTGTSCLSIDENNVIYDENGIVESVLSALKEVSA